MEFFPHRFDSRGKTEDSTGSDDVLMTLEENVDADSGSMSGLSIMLDENGRYQLRSDTEQGAVTYRVVQLTHGEDGQTQLVAGLSPTQQSLLHSIANGSSPTDEGGAGDSRFTFLSNNSEQAQSGETATANLISSSSGQFYLMVAPQDNSSALSGQTSSVRQLAPRFTSIKAESGLRITRDDRRRATHNEVERRRRDKINNWITQLGKLVPDCAAEQSKQGDSKGGILAKTCEYIAELQTANAQMAESLKETEKIANDVQALRQQYNELKLQNERLCNELRQHGIEPS